MAILEVVDDADGEPDELIGAELCGPDDDILLVSRKGSGLRFKADDTQLRPMGRATSGVCSTSAAI